MHTMDPDFFTGIGRVSAFGAQKYHMRNFLMAPGMAWGRVYDSAIGHLMAHWGGEDLDEESGLPHILHAAWNVMVLFTYWKNEPYHPGDDRPAKVEYAGRKWTDWQAEFDAVRLGQTKDGPDPDELGQTLEAMQAGAQSIVDRIRDPDDRVNAQARVRDPDFFKDALRAFYVNQNKGNSTDVA